MNSEFDAEAVGLEYLDIELAEVDQSFDDGCMHAFGELQYSFIVYYGIIYPLVISFLFNILLWCCFHEYLSGRDKGDKIVKDLIQIRKTQTNIFLKHMGLEME